MNYPRLSVFLVISISLIIIGVAVWVATHLPIQSSVANQIHFQGPNTLHEGFAAWNVSGSSGFEPAKTGHALRYTVGDTVGEWVYGLPFNTCGGTVAFYYLASRDWDPSNAYFTVPAIDALSERSLHVDSVSGFRNFVDALTSNGLSISDLNVTWGVQSLGNDAIGQDWALTGGAIPYTASKWLETRLYTGGFFTIKLDGQNMVNGPMPRTIATIKYNDTDDCLDDEISAVTETAFPSNSSFGSSPAVRAAAAAFLLDLRNGGIWFAFTSVQPSTGQRTFSGNGRTGAFFNLQNGRIEARVRGPR